MAKAVKDILSDGSAPKTVGKGKGVRATEDGKLPKGLRTAI